VRSRQHVVERAVLGLDQRQQVVDQEVGDEGEREERRESHDREQQVRLADAFAYEHERRVNWLTVVAHNANVGALLTERLTVVSPASDQ
jgi:hypothetical protein